MPTTEADSARRPFIGTWTLKTYTESSPSSSLVQPFGPSPIGRLIYTKDGFVSAQLMRPDRRQLTGGTWDTNHSEDLAELAQGYIAYCGLYEVDKEAQQVTHTPVVALIPSLLGQAQLRKFKFCDEGLTLRTYRTASNGETVETVLVWSRVASLQHEDK